MSDRELLEMAAKAAGLDSTISMYGFSDIGEPLLDANEPPTVWNPLTDDGDALRLAVNVGLKLNVSVTSKAAQVGGVGTFVEIDFDADPYAATRRAITRAAAELGKAMP